MLNSDESERPHTYWHCRNVFASLNVNVISKTEWQNIVYTIFQQTCFNCKVSQYATQIFISLQNGIIMRRNAYIIH